MASARPIRDTDTKLRGVAAPVREGLAALLLPASEAAGVGSTNTVVSAVTTRGGAMLVGKAAREAEATLEVVDELEDVVVIEAFVILADVL